MIRFSFKPSRQSARRRRALVEDIGRLSTKFEKLTDTDLAAHVREQLILGSQADMKRDQSVSESFACLRELAHRTVGLRPYDVQIEAGLSLLDSGIVELATGEGKTLVATLPAATQALTGQNVHVITINDFLARRDYLSMGPFYTALGLKVGLILRGMPSDERRRAYACHIVYGTTKEFGLDFLRDQLLRLSRPPRLGDRISSLFSEESSGSGGPVQRGHDVALIDDADSVLIDEARVPLLLSNRPTVSPEARLYEMARVIADRLLAETDYDLDDRSKIAILTDEGLENAYGFLPEGYTPSGSERPWSSFVENALCARSFFSRDKDYFVVDDALVLVDASSGRRLPDAYLRDGLHQAVQAKEGIAIRGEARVLGQLTLQRYFRRYRKLTGMSGPASVGATEFRTTYRVPVVSLRTHRPVKRMLCPDRVYRTRDAKFAAIVAEVEGAMRNGRPVLVGTRSVVMSEMLSEVFKTKDIRHVVLDAHDNEHEAQQMACAGTTGRVTISTNMTGRGTDIKLAAGVAEREGLLVIGTERHDARRIDLQLAGRCGRRGNPGTVMFLLSLDDELFQRYATGRQLRALQRMEADTNGCLPDRAAAIFDTVQKRAERLHRELRCKLLAQERWNEETLSALVGAPSN